MMEQPICPAYCIEGPYVLHCILPSGHGGDHLASDIEEVPHVDR